MEGVEEVEDLEGMEWLEGIERVEGMEVFCNFIAILYLFCVFFIAALITFQDKLLFEYMFEL